MGRLCSPMAHCRRQSSLIIGSKSPESLMFWFQRICQPKLTGPMLWRCPPSRQPRRQTSYPASTNGHGFSTLLKKQAAPPRASEPTASKTGIFLTRMVMALVVPEKMIFAPTNKILIRMVMVFQTASKCSHSASSSETSASKRQGSTPLPKVAGWLAPTPRKDSNPWPASCAASISACAFGSAVATWMLPMALETSTKTISAG